MSFVDIRFLLFFPAVVFLNFLTPSRFRWVVLLIASYIFYMAWKPEYGLILLGITTVDFIAGKMMGAIADPRRRKAWLVISLVANVGLLFVFKYFNFIFASVGEIFRVFGSNASIPLLGLILPIGISFHVFQSISYTIDVYLKRVEPVSHFGKFALYVSFFPQLVAGPIERPTTLLPQFFEDRRFDPELARNGALLMVWGFFKKLVIADNLAPLVNAAYASPDSFTGPSLVLATVFFAYQIYCDFSGYTDIARGAANILGYRLVKNFDRPYASRSISEFWRRWHISLSSWFRDYVYIPLGGSRASRPRVAANLMATFLLSGLWHGANWTYVLWGGLNGTYLVSGNFWNTFKERVAGLCFRGKTLFLRSVWQRVFTFALISLAWVFFRASSSSAAFHILGRMSQGFGEFFSSLSSNAGSIHSLGMGVGLQGLVFAFLGVILMETIESLQTKGVVASRILSWSPVARYGLYSGFILLILLAGSFGGTHQFIYFQF